MHVQGLVARRCVIRGINVDSPPAGVTHDDLFWPNQAEASSGALTKDAQVLVTFEQAHPLAPNPYASSPAPWLSGSCGGDTAEVLDGFTFQGGDVQVLVWDPPSSTPSGRLGRISNCVFDMRHHWFVYPEGVPANFALDGPYFGLMLLKPYVQPTAGQPGGYYDQPLLIAHNTFIFGRWGDASSPGWLQDYARKPAVAIIDVTDPGCGPPTGNVVDPDNSLRGVGRAGIMGNLFRTMSLTVHGAMLGIERADTRFDVDPSPSTTSYVQTNAFDSQKANSPSVAGGGGQFFSAPVSATVASTQTCGALWSNHSNLPTSSTCSSPSTPPAFTQWPNNPAVEIWDGLTVGTGAGVDPGFVGEYLAITVPALFNYMDWRLLPGSPCEDVGYPISNQAPLYIPRIITSEAGVEFDTEVLPELGLFTGWDGEHWGNPRWNDSRYSTAPGNGTDCGFDETHLMVMAGSWDNFTNSHNMPGFLHPTAFDAPADRHMIFPTFAGGAVGSGSTTYGLATMNVTVHKKMLTPAPNRLAGWINPPESLTNPALDSSLPFGYRRKYILFNGSPSEPGFPTATWSFGLPVMPMTHSPVSGNTVQSLQFFDVILLDDECSTGSCFHSYFNTQAVILDAAPPAGTVLLRGNMQGEYR